MKEKRSRLLQAIRQTYNDFFHDYFITSDQVFTLRVRLNKSQAPNKRLPLRWEENG